MKPRSLFRSAAVLAAVLLAGVALAQEPGDDAAIAEFADRLGELIAPVRFDAGDMQLLLASWSDVSDILETDEEDDLEMGPDSVEAALAQALDSIYAAADNPAYRAWARAQGVDPDQWMRKAMRIMTFAQRQVMRQQWGSGGDLEAQLAELESQRAQVGDAMVDMMIRMARSLEQLRVAYESLPEPDRSEQDLLDAHMAELMQMMEGEDDDYGEYGEDPDTGYGGGATPDDPEAYTVSQLNEWCEDNWCAGDYRYEFTDLSCAGSVCTLSFRAEGRGSRLEDTVSFEYDLPLVDEYGDLDVTYWERVTDAISDWEDAR